MYIHTYWIWGAQQGINSRGLSIKYVLLYLLL